MLFLTFFCCLLECISLCLSVSTAESSEGPKRETETLAGEQPNCLCSSLILNKVRSSWNKTTMTSVLAFKIEPNVHERYLCSHASSSVHAVEDGEPLHKVRWADSRLHWCSSEVSRLLWENPLSPPQQMDYNILGIPRVQGKPICIQAGFFYLYCSLCPSPTHLW